MAEKKQSSSRSKAKPKKKTAPKSARAKKSSSGDGGIGFDKSVEHFRENLKHSITLSRDRLQDVVDDAVHRGRMTRGDAERMVSEILSKGRRQTDNLLAELERVIGQARKEVQGRDSAKPARKRTTKAARGAQSKSK